MLRGRAWLWADQGGVDQRLDGRAWMVGRLTGAQGDDAAQGDQMLTAISLASPGRAHELDQLVHAQGAPARLDRTGRWCR